MTRVVLDCSVVVPWFFPEKEGEYALSVFRDLLDGRIACSAPDLLAAEFGNVAWKKVLRKLCTPEQARTQFSAFLALPVDYHRLAVLAAPAFDLSVAAGITLYDSLYLTLAAALRFSLATTDRLLASQAEKLGVSVYAL